MARFSVRSYHDRAREAFLGLRRVSYGHCPKSKCTFPDQGALTFSTSNTPRKLEHHKTSDHMITTLLLTPAQRTSTTLPPPTPTHAHHPKEPTNYNQSTHLHSTLFSHHQNQQPSPYNISTTSLVLTTVSIFLGAFLSKSRSSNRCHARGEKGRGSSLSYSSAGVKLVLGRGESGYVPYMLDFYPR
ncbi:hypothetical protein BDR22DRAFT_352465 [Usnea florida]